MRFDFERLFFMKFVPLFCHFNFYNYYYLIYSMSTVFFAFSISFCVCCPVSRFRISKLIKLGITFTPHTGIIIIKFIKNYEFFGHSSDFERCIEFGSLFSVTIYILNSIFRWFCRIYIFFYFTGCVCARRNITVL